MPGSSFQPAGELAGVPQIGVGVIGYGFMGRAHSLGYKRQIDAYWPPKVLPRLLAICGRNGERVRAAAQRWGYEGYYTDWRELIADPAVRIVDNCTQPFLHAEPSLAALAAGKHVLCEKPLAPTLAEARQMRDAARQSGKVHMTGLNYRFVPAIRLAYEIVQSGALGELQLFRASYLQEFRRDPTMPALSGSPEGRGRGVVGNLGAHAIDLAYHLVGDIARVSGVVVNHIARRPAAAGASELIPEKEEDTAHGLLEFANGVTGFVEATQVATGRKNQLVLEINGSRGSLRFDLERLNELQVYLLDEQDPLKMGFRDIVVTEGAHPLLKHWWPRGHVLAWENTFVGELNHLLTCVAEGRQAGPEGASFEDGYKAALVGEALRVSSREGHRVDVQSLE
ncbi:MAG: Gfo/Idh/MocA family oxidoreductase [Chloroflexi bacterium]|nr:Gfo/Idh/MocA family oxidoreductase [Chloroflexota bacterium]